MLPKAEFCRFEVSRQFPDNLRRSNGGRADRARAAVQTGVTGRQATREIVFGVLPAAFLFCFSYLSESPPTLLILRGFARENTAAFRKLLLVMDGQGADSHDSGQDPKGKGKEEPSALVAGSVEHQQQNQDASADSSLLTRIASSTSDLSRAVLLRRSERLHDGPSLKPQSQSNTASEPAYRSQTALFHAQKTDGPSTETTFAQPQSTSTAGEERYADFLGAQVDLATAQRVPLQASPRLGRPSAVIKQESRDGQQVIDLLNLPSEMDGIDSTNASRNQPLLSRQEQSALKEALFGHGGRKATPRWETLLNFHPGFLQEYNEPEILQHFGDVDPVEAKARWMDGWNDVLTSYNDEVWGDLGPLAREAQREIDEARGQGSRQGPEKMKALGRLRQILAHVRGPEMGFNIMAGE